jgi:hypothetical protein
VLAHGAKGKVRHFECGLAMLWKFQPGAGDGAPGAALAERDHDSALERGFRKIAGYRSLAKLDAALRAHDAALARGIDNRKQAAEMTIAPSLNSNSDSGIACGAEGQPIGHQSARG